MHVPKVMIPLFHHLTPQNIQHILNDIRKKNVMNHFHFYFDVSNTNTPNPKISDPNLSDYVRLISHIEMLYQSLQILLSTIFLKDDQNFPDVIQESRNTLKDSNLFLHLVNSYVDQVGPPSTLVSMEYFNESVDSQTPDFKMFRKQEFATYFSSLITGYSNFVSLITYNNKTNIDVWPVLEQILPPFIDRVSNFFSDYADRLENAPNILAASEIAREKSSEIQSLLPPLQSIPTIKSKSQSKDVPIIFGDLISLQQINFEDIILIFNTIIKPLQEFQEKATLITRSLPETQYYFPPHLKIIVPFLEKTAASLFSIATRGFNTYIDEKTKTTILFQMKSLKNFKDYPNFVENIQNAAKNNETLMKQQ